MSLPTLSVVIAAWPDLRGLFGALEALEPHVVAGCDVTVVSPCPREEDVAQGFPRTHWIEAPRAALIPHLWAIGIARAQGQVVATTTAHFRPAPGWIDAIRSAHADSPAAAIGGPIDPPQAGSSSDWAVYLLRYGAYLAEPPVAHAVGDLAGDNASYKRSALEAHPEAVRDGFWEHELHQALGAEGETLVFDPRLRVRQHACFDFSTFLGQRFRHGVHFGRTRLRRRARAVGPAAALLTVFLPALLLGRTAARVLGARRHVLPFLHALPALAAFACAWSVGEATGYLWHALARANPAPASARA